MDRIKQPERYGRTCMNCAWKHHPQMLTTYCLKGTTCSYCGRVTETAIVDFEPPKKTTESPSATVRCPDHRNGGATRCPRGGADLQIWQRKQWGD